MTRITDASTSWSAGVTTSETEIWQCLKGGVYLTVTSTPAGDDGIRLDLTGGVTVASGKTVYYKLSEGFSSAVIAREAIS